MSYRGDLGPEIEPRSQLALEAQHCVHEIVVLDGQYTVVSAQPGLVVSKTAPVEHHYYRLQRQD